MPFFYIGKQKLLTMLIKYSVYGCFFVLWKLYKKVFEFYLSGLLRAILVFSFHFKQFLRFSFHNRLIGLGQIHY
jgi:hypothetical protein